MLGRAGSDRISLSDRYFEHEINCGERKDGEKPHSYGHFSTSVTGTVGIQNNVLIDPAGPDATILVNVNKIFKYQYIKFSEKHIK